jgi:hypothetical protein
MTALPQIETSHPIWRALDTPILCFSDEFPTSPLVHPLQTCAQKISLVSVSAATRTLNSRASTSPLDAVHAGGVPLLPGAGLDAFLVERCGNLVDSHTLPTKFPPAINADSLYRSRTIGFPSLTAPILGSDALTGTPQLLDDHGSFILSEGTQHLPHERAGGIVGAEVEFSHTDDLKAVALQVRDDRRRIPLFPMKIDLLCLLRLRKPPLINRINNMPKLLGSDRR